MTPRENMLKILRGENADWIPVFVYYDNFNCPNLETLPSELMEKFRNKTSRFEGYFILSEYLGINEYILNAPLPLKIIIGNGAEEKHQDDGLKTIQVKSGILTQKSESHGGESYVTERLVKDRNDIIKLSEYFEEWRFELNPDAIAEIRRMKGLVKDNGLIWLFANGGTPLGMMYRVYSDISTLIFLITDYKEEIKALFDIMEKKYLEMFELILKYAPEIDIIVGMDDTSTTLISPAMFDEFNVKLTNTRTDLIHKYGKYYLHHSCGLIKDLLPIYRKTRIDGVHAFTTPPIGNVTFAEGRKLLGDKITIVGSLISDDIKCGDSETPSKIRHRFENIKSAGNIMLYLTAPCNTYSIEFMKKVWNETMKYQKR